jgi:choline kinase
MTRAVILAAGEGTRLRPLTERLPKALMPLAGVPLFTRQAAVLRHAGIDDLSVVTGHAAQAFDGCGARPFHNEQFASTNMVASLHCAQPLFDGSDDVVVAYGDIVYEPRVLAALLATEAPVAVTVDLGWHRLWSLRMDDPLSDAETMKLDATGHIVELGRKPRGLEDIQGQYIGLFKVSRSFAPSFFAFYEQMPEGSLFEGRPREKMFMTSYLQHHIDRGTPVRAAPVTHGWIEIDSVQDLQRYEAAIAQGRLAPLYDADA